MHEIIQQVTERIVERSKNTRRQYLNFIDQQAKLKQQHNQAARFNLSCTNMAHEFAAAQVDEKTILKQSHRAANMAIISSYNDILSAHQPYHNYPEKIKKYLASQGQVGQMAGGVPAMCDGVTQGQLGMELSLFSRDTIALSTAIALSHDAFDGVVLLGICDKIVPGLLMAALRFGHLPAVFLPSGPMASGISNQQKAKVRQAHAKGQATDQQLMESEHASYHSAGTCTFYGTANSNQMLLEIMGLQLPNSSFVAPDSELREGLNHCALDRLIGHTDLSDDFLPLGQMLDEKSLVNAMIGLLATGGSTNHTIHLIAIGKMMGVQLDWQDFGDLSQVTPLLTKLYPNGQGDVNDFHRVGGMSFLIKELLSEGLLHQDVNTMLGRGLDLYAQQPELQMAANEQTDTRSEKKIKWLPANSESLDLSLLSPVHAPFAREGGIKLLSGNLGRAIIKTSAMPKDRWLIKAPAKVFSTQEQVLAAYQNHQLDCDAVIVVRNQGPMANGMPELHKLMPALSNLQEQGFSVALLTDGRLSGASGKVPAAIHVCPEALAGGVIGQIKNGDDIIIDVHAGTFSLLADTEKTASINTGQDAVTDGQENMGLGREMFSHFRRHVSAADQGAVTFDF